MQATSASVMPTSFEEARSIVTQRLLENGLVLAHAELLEDERGPVAIWLARPGDDALPPTLAPGRQPRTLFARLAHLGADRCSLQVWGAEISAVITNPAVPTTFVHRRPAPRTRR